LKVIQFLYEIKLIFAGIHTMIYLNGAKTVKNL